MLGSTCRNPKELKDKILTRLGAPVVHVEVSESQIYECIQQALELYGEYHHDGVNKVFFSVKLTEDQAKTGFINTSKWPIYAITEMLRVNMGDWTIDGNATYSWFNDFLTGLTGMGQGSVNYHGPFSGGGGLSMYSMMMSYQKTMQDTLNPLPDYWFNATNGQLQLSGNFKEGEVIVFEAYVQSYMDMEQANNTIGNKNIKIGLNEENTEAEIYNNPYDALSKWTIGKNDSLDQNVYDVRWVKDYSTSLVKLMQGTNLAKHQGLQLPGGIEIDGVRLISDAKEEIAVLRDELMLLTEPAPIVMG